MYKPRNKSITPFAKELRKSMTKEERHLWYDFLRHCTPRFRRQEIIGSYIADFYCHKAKLVVELDGSQHMDPEGIAYDDRRTAYFHSLGIEVVRYYNTDVSNNFGGVCQNILDTLSLRGVHPSVTFGDSSPQGEPYPSAAFGGSSPQGEPYPSAAFGGSSPQGEP